MTATCTICFRIVAVDDAGKLAVHVHTPMLAGAKCEGGGRTPQQAKDYAKEELRKYRERKNAK